MEQFDENLLNIESYEVLGELPDPFLFDDGTRVKNVSEWPRRRAEMFKTAVELQYGTIPPDPEFLDVETTYLGGNAASFIIRTGTRAKPVSFRLKVIFPKSKNRPVIVDGDLCFNYAHNDGFIRAATDLDVGWALFDRTELAYDLPGVKERRGPLFETYPEYTFGALAAWAWGYMRVVDALEKIALPAFNLDAIAFSGHSRGGKTAALAGVLDTRAAFVNPNATCAGACGCYRVHVTASSKDTPSFKSETLADILRNFPQWFGPDIHRYADRENELPFDTHFLKAMVAPRVLFVSEAAEDFWSNPVGSWHSSVAAAEVFDFLGVPENIYWYFRKGTHFHKPEDVSAFASIIAHHVDGKPLPDIYFKTPFKPFEKIYTWKKPE